MLLNYLINKSITIKVCIICTTLFLSQINESVAQSQTKDTFVTISNDDTTLSKNRPSNVDSFLWEMKYRKNPKRAGLYSALMPGLGQIYNRQYWKVGVVYAAMGTSSGFIIYNYSEWNNARRELAFRLSNNIKRDEKLKYLDNNQLSRKQDYDRQNLDMSVLITSGFYLLQIIEAISANHLKDFDITPDISMRFISSPLPNHQVGIGLAFYFK